MKRHIVCLGDSNTHGYCADPADCADGSLRRFNESERWTCRLQAALGEDFLVLEEGLPGRTTVFDDPVEESLSALPYLYPCLMSHAPVSLLVAAFIAKRTYDMFRLQSQVRGEQTGFAWCGRHSPSTAGRAGSPTF